MGKCNKYIQLRSIQLLRAPRNILVSRVHKNKHDYLPSATVFRKQRPESSQSAAFVSVLLTHNTRKQGRFVPEDFYCFFLCMETLA